MTRANSIELVGCQRHVGCQRDKAHHEKRRGVVRGGNLRERVELRQRHGEHGIQR